MTVIIELMTALLKYLDLGIVQSADFLAVKALLLPQNASIIPDSYTYLLYARNYAGIIASSLLQAHIWVYKLISEYFAWI